jgi:hypothetical protein
MTSDNKTRRDFWQPQLEGRWGRAALSASSWNSVLGANERIRLGVIGTGNREVTSCQSFSKNRRSM